MAKRHSKKPRNYYQNLPSQRVLHKTPKTDTTSLLRRVKDLQRRLHDRRTILPDRRRFDPTSTVPPVHRLDGRIARITRTPAQPRTYQRTLNDRAAFADPLRTTVCRRRKDRRLALFAKRLIGKGKGSGKKRHYNEYSKVRC